MQAHAILFEGPKDIRLQSLEVKPPEVGDLQVDVCYSGISTGTERLLWDGSMPPFPGMGYPLVPGYESVGQISRVQADCDLRVGDFVFVPGAYSFQGVHNLFGGSGERLVVPSSRVIKVSPDNLEQSVLLALAATAYHTVSKGGQTGPASPPDLIVGHGIMGRLLARMTVASGHPAPTVWELNSERTHGAMGYNVLNPEDDPRKDYKAIYDVSGDSKILNQLISRLAAGGEIVLGGFYTEDLSFAFPMAFMKEASIRVAAQWKRCDLEAVSSLIESNRLSLDGLVTHQSTPTSARQAYETAFCDPSCLKMTLNWRH